jgi:hypothetical protein
MCIDEKARNGCFIRVDGGIATAAAASCIPRVLLMVACFLTVAPGFAEAKTPAATPSPASRVSPVPSTADAAAPPLPLPPNTIVPTDNTAGESAGTSTGHFAVSPDGSSSFNYPIWAPQGRRGLEPALTIHYNSRTANGPMGVGWSLQGLSSISRCKADMARDGYNAPISFTPTDAFCLDGQRLIVVPGAATGVKGRYGQPGTEYDTEEDRFARVINGPVDEYGPVSFEVDLKDGRRLFYGTTQVLAWKDTGFIAPRRRCRVPGSDRHSAVRATLLGDR